MIEAGAVTALKYGWHFDRAYLEGLKDQYDKDHDSTISDEELQVWLANSIKTLDTFGSFTTLRLGREPLAVGHSDGHRAERSDSGITLHFTLHLARPAVLKVTSLQIDLFDRSFFTEFVLGAGHGITVQAVRSGTCSASVALAPNSEQQRAITAFMKSFGRIDANLAPARSITVTCRD